MATITYTGLSESSFAFLQYRQAGEADIFIEIGEENAKSELSAIATDADVYLIGEKAGNPIKLAQTAHALDHYLSVVILNDPLSFSKIKQALLFTPFIGNTVKNLSNEIAAGLAPATQDAIVRTRQRRNFSRIQASPVAMKPSVHVYEDIKSEYLDKFLDEAPVGAVLMTEKGLVLAVNRYATKILDLSEKDLIGAPITALFDLEQQPMLLAYLESKATTLSPLLMSRMASSGKQVLEIRMAHITLKNRIPYRLGIFTDTTQTHNAHQRVKQQIEELKTINEQLSRANADLDAFIYTASHDLKAPIANIEGIIELLKRRIDQSDPQVYSLFAMVEISIDRFQKTIKDLTEIAHGQLKATDDQLVNSACEVIDEVQTLIMEMIVGADAKTIIDCAPDLGLAFSRSNFRSIVFNLMSNAIKYRSPKRPAVIKVSLSPGPPGFSLLTVEDNGLGIAADKLDKIFDMFKRMHTHVEGTGIGLFIVKRIIDSTGSKIEVSSTEGQGTTFRVYLKELQD